MIPADEFRSSLFNILIFIMGTWQGVPPSLSLSQQSELFFILWAIYFWCHLATVRNYLLASNLILNFVLSIHSFFKMSSRAQRLGLRAFLKQFYIFFFRIALQDSSSEKFNWLNQIRFSSSYPQPMAVSEIEWLTKFHSIRIHLLQGVWNSRNHINVNLLYLILIGNNF